MAWHMDWKSYNKAIDDAILVIQHRRGPDFHALCDALCADLKAFKVWTDEHSRVVRLHHDEWLPSQAYFGWVGYIRAKQRELAS